MQKNMSYLEVLKYMYSQLPMFQRIGGAAYKANLDNTLAFDEYFNHPHKKFKMIHVAGTNGKGSVSHLLASILQSAGYKTGLYTSPHLKDFRERIKVDGSMMPEVDVVDFIKHHQSIIESIKPSFFELTVAMAFDYFASQEVDIAVVEVGMGGRLDSTNIIQPLVSVITNIGMDHMTFLGNTLSEIAGEKAGIIKSGVPVIVGEFQNETMPVFVAKANEVGTSVVCASAAYQVEFSTQTSDFLQQFYIRNNAAEMVYDGLMTPLLGFYQQKNCCTVLATIDELRKLDVKILDASVLEGFRNVVKQSGLMGRWQILDVNPLIICDTAHNEAGFSEVLKQLSSMAYKQLHMIIGFVNDKDIQTILAMLPKDATLYFTQASIPRAMAVDNLFELASKCGLHGRKYQNVDLALQAAKKNTSINDLIFIGGSTFIVAEVV